jgi:hypothetical protein
MGQQRVEIGVASSTDSFGHSYTVADGLYGMGQTAVNGTLLLSSIRYRLSRRITYEGEVGFFGSDCGNEYWSFQYKTKLTRIRDSVADHNTL